MDIQKFYRGIKLGDTGAVFKITKDNLKAFVEGVDKDNIVKVNSHLKEVFKEAGICFGLLNPPRLQDDVLFVAEGISPEPGIDGRIDIVASSYLERKRADAKADPRNLCLIDNVFKGEIIARRIPPTAGKPGKDIFGNIMDPEPGHTVYFKPGNLVEIQNPDTMAATASGALVIDPDGTISVMPEWTIDGDVDFSTGHVEFYGKKLEITGSVLGGFTVETMGDLVIGGNIEDEAIVLAGGDVFVSGIIRSENTMVKTGGSLECGAIEYARAFVGRNLMVHDYILNGNCQIHGNAHICDGKGLVAGGQIIVGGSINVKTAGTSANVPTLLSAGRDPLLETHHNGLIKEQELLSEKLKKIQEGLKKIKRLESAGKKISEDQQIIKERLYKMALEIANQMNLNKEKIRKIEHDLGQMEAATVTVTHRAYPNVKIQICDASINLKELVEKISFFFKYGEIGAKTIA